jgi:hypothetical protein
MHIELVVPALLATQPVPRLPALELLAVRARARRDEPQALERWLARAFGVTEEPLAAGALTLLGEGGDPADGYWMRADPVHLRVEPDRLTLVPVAACGIERPEADALAATLNRHFGGEFTLLALHPERWCLRAARELVLDAPSPAELARGVLPRGGEARREHALMNEIQMVLHEHPVNLQREQRGAPAINSVWLWGAGRLPRGARGPWQSVMSDEPVALGLARLAGVRRGALPQTAAQWLERPPQDGRHLCVLDALHAARAMDDEETGPRQLEALEQRWFAPLLEALRQGRIGMLTVLVPDAGESWETTRADLRRFWRRPRPLAPRT